MGFRLYGDMPFIEKVSPILVTETCTQYSAIFLKAWIIVVDFLKSIEKVYVKRERRQTAYFHQKWSTIEVCLSSCIFASLATQVM